MSAVKNPREKKRLSLQRDRRNTYGENDKSSRKSIPRSKQRTHMKERRRVAGALKPLSAAVSDDEADRAQAAAKEMSLLARRKGFKKTPDTALGQVLDRKRILASAAREDVVGSLYGLVVGGERVR